MRTEVEVLPGVIEYLSDDPEITAKRVNGHITHALEVFSDRDYIKVREALMRALGHVDHAISGRVAPRK